MSAPQAAQPTVDAGRYSPALVELAATALAAVLRFERPADAVLSAFFRAHPKLGQHDRAFVAETIYAVLRHRGFLELAVAECPSPRPRPFARALVLASIVRLRGANLRELERLLSVAEVDWARALKGVARGELPFAVACELPDWLIERLRPVMGESELLALGRALQHPAPLDLRANVNKANRDEVARRLAEDGIVAHPTPYSPVGLRVDGKPALTRHALFVDGTIEVQDEGSQLLAYLVAPKRGEMVVDFCAGAGGKTLALGAQMRSTGRLYAFDVSPARLARLKPRLARSGLSNVHPQAIDSERDPRVRRLAGKIDRVLIDAPCSGFGTLRRNPDLKWRQSETAIAELAAKQAAILAAAAVLVKPGGRLVYATCTFLPEENERVVEAFLAAHPDFRLVPAADVLAESRIEVPGVEDGPYLRLHPHRHGTDGFFAAVMERAR